VDREDVSLFNDTIIIIIIIIIITIKVKLSRKK